jgi:hypothetical protein
MTVNLKDSSLQDLTTYEKRREDGTGDRAGLYVIHQSAS